MAEITAAAVKALRQETDLPMMACKKALAEANGDPEKAKQILAEKLKIKVESRGDNVTSEGRVFVAVNDDNSKAAMVEIQCETAPVASNDEFKALGAAMAQQLLDGPGASTADELLAQDSPDGSGKTLGQQFETLVNKILEKFVVGRVGTFEGPFGSYVHHDGKTAAIFCAKGGDSGAEILRGVAMHIAALKPKFATTGEIDPAAVAEERERLVAEAKATGKPDNIIDKIVDGRMSVFYANSEVLAAQPYAKDDSKTVEKALAEEGYEPVSFALWVLGANA